MTPATESATATLPTAAKKATKRTGSRASSTAPTPEVAEPTLEDPAEMTNDVAQVTEVITTTVEEASSSLKRKADDCKSPTATLEDEDANQQPPAKKRKKAEPASKKPKAPSTKPRKVATPRGPRAKKNAKQPVPAEDLPAPDAPAEISLPIYHKIQQVKSALAQKHPTVLGRNDHNPNLIIIPSSQLIATIMNMRAQYQIGRQYDAKYEDVSEAIVDVFQHPIGLNPNLVDWFVVDVSRATAFEDVIKRKIENWGLEGVSLFEVECEMMQRQSTGFPMPRWRAESLEAYVVWGGGSSPVSEVGGTGADVDVDDDESPVVGSYAKMFAAFAAKEAEEESEEE